MSWNYRVIKHVAPKTNEVFLQLHEVYYSDQDSEPNGVTIDAVTVGGETTDEIKWVLEKMAEALEKPILDYSDFDEKTHAIKER